MSATRVLLVDFGAIARQGFRDTLADAGCEVFAEPRADALTGRVRDLRADAVVLCLDREETRGLAQELLAAFPELRVVACSAEHRQMHVFAPGDAPDRDLSVLDPTRLAVAVKGSS